MKATETFAEIVKREGFGIDPADEVVETEVVETPGSPSSYQMRECEGAQELMALIQEGGES